MQDITISFATAGRRTRRVPHQPTPATTPRLANYPLPRRTVVPREKALTIVATAPGCAPTTCAATSTPSPTPSPSTTPGDPHSCGLLDITILIHHAGLDLPARPARWPSARSPSPNAPPTRTPPTTPGRRAADPLITVIAAATQPPPYTTTDDHGLDDQLTVIAIPPQSDQSRRPSDPRHWRRATTRTTMDLQRAQRAHGPPRS